MSIYQIVYISAATVTFTDDDLRELLAIAQKNNETLGVSGMLLYQNGSFIQVLEGQKSDVEAVFSKIERDSRHSNTTVLLKGDVADRTFESWAMGFLPTKTLSDIPEGFHPFLKTGFQGSLDTENAVHSALLAFKGGRWRSKF